jgi:hypothetical protein
MNDKFPPSNGGVPCIARELLVVEKTGRLDWMKSGLDARLSMPAAANFFVMQVVSLVKLLTNRRILQRGTGPLF